MKNKRRFQGRLVSLLIKDRTGFFNLTMDTFGTLRADFGWLSGVYKSIGKCLWSVQLIQLISC